MKKIKKKQMSKGFKDTFNLFMIEKIDLVGDYEMPYIKKYVGAEPKKIVNYIKNVKGKENYFVHFYLYDYMFDGKNGIWYGCQQNSVKIESFLRKIEKYDGIISPDYSIYVDLPLSAQIWNIYRDRVIYAWLYELGYKVIFNLRWGDYRTYNIVFNGIEKHGTVAIGSHGLIKNPENRQIFMDGFKEMIKRIEPKEIILYGPYTNEMKNLCENNGIKVAHFESEQTASRKELNK